MASFMAKFAAKFVLRILQGDFGLCCHLLMAIWVDWYLSSHFVVLCICHLSHTLVFCYHLSFLALGFKLEDFFSIMNDVHSCLQLHGNIYYP